MSKHAQSPGLAHARPHMLIWSFAIAAVVCAGAVVAARSALDQRSPLTRDPDAVAEAAIARVEADPSLNERGTQALLRLAAVLVEENALESAEGDYLLAQQYRREHNLTGAEVMFKRAISRRPDWSRPHAGLGALLGRNTIGRKEESLQELRRAIELDPEWHQPWNDLGVVLRVVGRLDEAEEAARKAVALAPDAVAPRNNLANLMFELQRYQEAEASYLKAIELSPNHPKPWYNLACLYSILGRKDDAIANLRAGIQRASVLRNEASADSDFDAIRDDPAFRRLVYGPERDRQGEDHAPS